MTKLHLVLHALDRLPQVVQSEVVWHLRNAFGPLAERAGKKLMISFGDQMGDLNLTFDTTEQALPPGVLCGTGIALGRDGETVNVRAHREMRVCSPVDPATGKRDVRRILSTDRLMGKALGNTAVHELGHYIALLEDVRIKDGPSNFMVSGDLQGNQRTLKGTRKFFAGHQSFSESQKEALVTQIRKGEWLGELAFH
jgi:hypothetical protein